MMKKAISLFLAVSVLCVTTSAMAATMGTAGGDRKNNITVFSGSAGGSMPLYKQGDTITFNVSAVASGSQLTVISYKYGGSINNSTAQYINQYDSATTVSFKVRNTESGIYMIKINDEQTTAATYYYAVGDVTATMLNQVGQEEGTPYLALQDDNGMWSVGFLGKVTIDSADLTLAILGANPGFTVTEGGNAKSYAFGEGLNETAGKTVAGLQATRFADLEVSGSYSFIYGLTIYHVTDGHEDDLSATTGAFITDAE